MKAHGAPSGFEIDRGPLIFAALLVGLGGLIAFLGMAIGTKSAVTHGRRYIEAMDPSPSELARLKWSQLRAAGAAGASAGADAWKTSIVPIATLS
jgi:hypothetical protein